MKNNQKNETQKNKNCGNKNSSKNCGNKFKQTENNEYTGRD